MSNVSDLLKKKGPDVYSVKPADTIQTVLKLMAEKNIGAVLVLEGHKLAGIFSERDFARHCAKKSVNPESVLVKDMMTTHILNVNPQTTTDECMAIMTAKHIRHLPVIDHEQLVGMISIGDVVKQIIVDHKFSIEQLERYVKGEV